MLYLLYHPMTFQLKYLTILFEALPFLRYLTGWAQMVYSRPLKRAFLSKKRIEMTFCTKICFFQRLSYDAPWREWWSPWDISVAFHCYCSFSASCRTEGHYSLRRISKPQCLHIWNHATFWNLIPNIKIKCIFFTFVRYKAAASACKASHSTQFFQTENLKMEKTDLQQIFLFSKCSWKMLWSSIVDSVPVFPH